MQVITITNARLVHLHLLEKGDENPGSRFEGTEHRHWVLRVTRCTFVAAGIKNPKGTFYWTGRTEGEGLVKYDRVGHLRIKSQCESDLRKASAACCVVWLSSWEFWLYFAILASNHGILHTRPQRQFGAKPRPNSIP